MDTLQIPEHILRAGSIKYPDRVPYPMVYSAEMLTGNGIGFSNGTDTSIVRANIPVDVSNPTYLVGISFGLVRTGRPNGSALPLNCFLPVAMTEDSSVLPAGGEFVGRCFEWKYRYSGITRVAQDGTGWRASSQALTRSMYGYIPTTSYEMGQNDNLLIEARPLGEGIEEDTYSLIVYTHYYQMIVENSRLGR